MALTKEQLTEKISDTFFEFNEEVLEQSNRLYVITEKLKLYILPALKDIINDTVDYAEVNGSVTVSSINDIGNVIASSPNNSDLLSYNGSNWITQSLSDLNISEIGHTHSADDITSGTISLDRLSIGIGDLSNVDLTGIQTNYVLKWDGSQFTAQADATGGGGGGGDMFKATYDTNDNGIVDNAENLNSQSASFYLNYNNFTNTPTIVDWTLASQGTIHPSNYTDTNTTYTAGTGLDLTGTEFSVNLSASDIPNTVDAAKIANGTVSNAEFQYLNGVTSSIQTQIDSKANSSHSHELSDITDITANAAEINVLDGVTATTAEINYIDGVTSNIQTQLNNKASSTHGHKAYVKTETGTSYTLSASDKTNIDNNVTGTIQMNNVSANTLTIPPDSTVNFDIGTIWNIFQLGAGQTEILAGAGVTLYGVADGSSDYKIEAQYRMVSIQKLTANTWLVVGALAS